MSEGSSDNEGAEDDLSPAQTNYLLQVIKGKCPSVSRCRMRTKNRPIRKTTEDNMELPLDQPPLLERNAVPENAAEGEPSEEVFRDRKAINIRRPVGSKERIG